MSALGPLDVYDAILHEVALGRAEAAPRTPRTRALVSALRTGMERLLDSSRELHGDSTHDSNTIASPDIRKG